MLVSFVEQLSRRKKQVIAVSADCIMLPIALWTALALRLGEWSPEVVQFWPAFVVSALVCIPVFTRLGLYRQIIRYMGNHAMLAVVKGVTISAFAITAVAYMVPLKGFPRSVPIIFWLISLVYVAGTRFGVRAYFDWLSRKFQEKKPVLIYGAGATGAEMARMLQQQGEYFPAGFIDDDKRLQKRTINGVYVYAPEQLNDLIRDTRIREVLVAVPSSEADARQRVIEFLEPFSVKVRLIPDLSDLVAGRNALEDIRDVSVEDLLGRDAVEPLMPLLQGSVRDQVVLVTGAGGSIGSELCRQIVRLMPKMLLMLDQSEYGLYRIQREIRALTEAENLDTACVTVLGSVTDPALMQRTLASYRVDTLYHAAAYKHVALVERNVIQGLKNNTFGTLYTAEAALEAGVRNFILISTDKAVRTTNVMGASKRLAELVLQALQEQTQHTIFSMVRFGNVLGSSGSVVPLFMEQIDKGGPVTVTHADVTRFFMTIPEAAQLVLQAATMAKGGDVFVLDMGEPVRILDLARRMIRLRGHTIKDSENPHGEIEIQFTGLKPGEKLYEELLIAEASSGTRHRKIMRAEERFVPWSELRGALNTLEQACDSFDYEAIKSFIESLIEGTDLAVQLIDLADPISQVQRATVVPLNPSNSTPGDSS